MRNTRNNWTTRREGMKVEKIILLIRDLCKNQSCIHAKLLKHFMLYILVKALPPVQYGKDSTSQEYG